MVWGDRQMKLAGWKIVAGLLLVTLAAAMIFGNRPWALANQPMVTHLRAIKLPKDVDFVYELDSYGLHVQQSWSPWERLVEVTKVMHGVPMRQPTFRDMTEPALGSSIREVSFFGMPFGWYRDMGDVVYVRNDWGAIYAPLVPATLARVNKENGGDVTQGNIFPFWLHLWGWLWIAGLGLLWHRANVRRREALGLID